MQNNKNAITATIISVLILLLWTWFYEKPRIEKQEAEKKALLESVKVSATNVSVPGSSNAPKPAAAINKPVTEAAIISPKDRSEILSQSTKDRIIIASDNLHGSISLHGARFDDLTLANYFTTTEKKSEVVLFSPAESKERYFTDFGWISSDSNLETPKPETIWKSDSKKLSPNQPVTLSWTNKQKVEFIIKISLDENYMFTINQVVKNFSNQDILVAPYARISRIHNVRESNYILHEGPIGVFNKVLHQTTYKDIIEEKRQEFNGANGGWIGITDKFWLSSIIPDKNFSYNADFSSDFANQNHTFGSELIGQEFKIAKNDELKFENHLFAGVKKVQLLDQYSKDFDIPLFDRAIDFGWFYFLTKPFFFIINFLSKWLGNFGLAILAMTVLVKLALFPMANESYLAVAKMKKLQPKVTALRERLKGDKIAMNRELIELYRKEKINPAAGCLPIVIQIPIFFALYKVLFVTLDMRHAPFYGWINDLSAPDPTSIFNLFGLLPFQVSSTFTIGIWPILMGLTMIIQQKLSPPSADPTQAKILKFMPYVLTFVLAAFPAGLVIYWTWSNLLSILQQWYITRKFESKKQK